MKIVKTTGALLIGAALCGVVGQSSAAQCDRYPNSGAAPFPPQLLTDTQILRCSDGTQGTVSADHRNPPTRRVHAFLTFVGPSGQGTVTSLGFNSGGGLSCIVSTSLLQRLRSDTCDTGVRTAVSWGALLRND